MEHFGLLRKREHNLNAFTWIDQLWGYIKHSYPTNNGNYANGTRAVQWSQQFNQLITVWWTVSLSNLDLACPLEAIKMLPFYCTFRSYLVARIPSMTGVAILIKHTRETTNLKFQSSTKVNDGTRLIRPLCIINALLMVNRLWITGNGPFSLDSYLSSPFWIQTRVNVHCN